MKRRVFLASIAAAGLLPAAAALASGNALQAAFEALSGTRRQRVQYKLSEAGFYQGAADGRYGRGTDAGLRNAAAFVADNSYGRVRPDVASAAGASAFLAGLLAGDYDAWFWGEGGETE